MKIPASSATAPANAAATNPR
uniref:Uncharacterized protein n=1 Tax=Arundo donax TaxID=35708 RepID=A0A0A9FLW5_ARUDO